MYPFCEALDHVLNDTSVCTFNNLHFKSLARESKHVQCLFETFDMDKCKWLFVGRHASSSGRSGANRDTESQKLQQGQPFGFPLGQKEGLPLSMYFAQRKLLVNSSDSFRIFCAALALLQVRSLV